MARWLLVPMFVLLLSPTTTVAGLLTDEITLTRVSGPLIPGVPFTGFPHFDTQIVRDGPEWQDSYGFQVDVADTSITLRNTSTFLDWTFGEGSDWRFTDLDSPGELIVGLTVSYHPNVSLPELFSPTIINDGKGIRLLNTGTGSSDDVVIFRFGAFYTINIEFGSAAPDPSNASFSSLSDVNQLSIDFGTLAVGATALPQSFEIWNIASLGSANLELETITGIGDTSALFTDLTQFTGLSPGDHLGFTAQMDTSAVGDFSAVYTLGFSDESGQSQSPLILNLTGSVVVPEPSTFAIWSLLGLAGLGYGWRKKRRAA